MAPATRYRLKLTSLKFISPVDMPAQQNATARLLKRNGDGPTFARVAKVADELGLVFAWAWTSKVAGADHFDLHGDAIDDGDEMIRVAADFMSGERLSDEMHNREADGQVVFGMPMTPEIAKAFGIETDTSGFMVALKPSAEVFAKFKTGEYTGISIDGMGVREPLAKGTAAKFYCSFNLGDRTRVIRGREHMPDHAGRHGTVTEMDSGAIGILFDGDVATHRWYSQSEIAPLDADEVAEIDAPEMADMKRAATTRTENVMTTDAETLKNLQAELAKVNAELVTAKAAIAKAAEPAPKPLYKSAAGTEYFNAESAELAKRLDQSERDRADVELTKRADEKSKHVPGTLAVRKAMLGAIENIADDETRKAALESFAAIDASLAKNFRPQGVNTTVDVSAESTASAEVAKRVEARMTAKGETREVATTYLVEHDSEFNTLRKQAKDERRAAARA